MVCHPILCYWLIPDRNATKDDIGHDSTSSLMRGPCVDGAKTKSHMYRCNRWIILGGAVCKEALVFCTSLLDCAYILWLGWSIVGIRDSVIMGMICLDSLLCNMLLVFYIEETH